MSIRCAWECVVVMGSNVDGFMPFDGFDTMSNLFHCSFQEIVHIFDATVCSGVSRTRLNVCECQSFG